jgi:anionic cell wall polymer biosynthesis LytR-Cps2A-Psr (LCP) family protein
VLSDKLEEMMGLSIHYYAMIDFAGFEKVIDTLGGIIIDVPSTLHDVTYPNGNGGYMTVHIDS